MIFFKRRKLVRGTALFLCVFLLHFTAVGSYQKAYATGVEIILGGGAVVFTGEALAYLLAAFGLFAASQVVYHNIDNLREWGDDRLEDFQRFANPENVAAVSAQIEAWMNDVAKGIVDTASDTWDSFKSWVSSLYSSSNPGLIHAVTGGEHFIYKNFSIYKNISFTDTSGLQNYIVSQGADVYSFFKFGVFYCQSTQPFVFRSYNLDGSFRDQYYGLSSYKVLNGVAYDYGGFTSSSGRYGWVSGGDVLSLGGVNYCPDPALFNDFWDSVLLGDMTAVPVTDYNVLDTGITDVIDRDGTFENVDFVGVGSVAGVTDVPIDWGLVGVIDGVKVGDISDILTGVINGTIDITDSLASGRVAVIDRSKDLVIDDTGVTDKPVTDVVIDASAFNDFTIAGLEKLFPFCIPFDLINFIGVLAAEPEAPRFKIPIKYLTLEGMATYEFDLDFSQFNSAAALLRDMECLLFIVGLILLTREKMIRG